jgi:hypothetical protein
MFVSIPQRGGMYKIGTGENDTIAGKVYLSVPSDKDGDVTWVFCQNKLYMRRAQEELGSLTIIDPNTFQVCGKAKLCCGEVFTQQGAQNFNRNYPLLSDGEYLYIVAMEIVKRPKHIKKSY